MKNKKIFIWERLDQKTIEYCTVIYNEAISVNSYITGIVNNIPFNTEYSLVINKSWQIKSFLIKITGETTKSFSMIRNKDGQWKDDTGNIFPEFGVCADIDISLTPLTNTLPIRRLSIKQNQSEEIDVLYIDLPSGNLKPVKQRYTNLGGNKYFYESLDSGFKAEININDDGFVTQYSVYWKLIKEI